MPSRRRVQALCARFACARTAYQMSSHDRGAGLAEYALLLLLVVVASAALVAGLSPAMVGVFNTMVGKLGN